MLYYDQMSRLLPLFGSLFALLLPWHGAVTIFLPGPFRYWKEILLLLFLLVFVTTEIYAWARKEFLRPNVMEWACMSFLLLGIILTAISADVSTAFIAFRYIGLGFIVYLILSRFLRYEENLCINFFHMFSTVFCFSLALAVVFGIWAKFGGGYEFLSEFYSQTISSWVPGQNIPLYHEIEGVPRMQGGSSGPIVFAHLLLAGCVFLPFLKAPTGMRTFLGLLFAFGIWQSMSRAAMLGLVVMFVIWGLQNLKLSRNVLVGAIAGFFLVSLGGLFFFPQILSRAGTSDHFTRPIEAIQMGVQSPWIGNIGKLGPAARAKNLAENNDDSAPIAENVFADWFAQLGILGLLIGLTFFFSVLWTANPQWIGFLVASFIAMNLATIFDMTPISITYFLIFAFARKFRRKVQ